MPTRGAGLLPVLVGAAFGCGGPAAGDVRALEKVRVSYSRHISWGPLLIAQAEGFFRDEGLDVEFVTALRPEESLVALVTGDIDVRPGPLHAGFLSSIAQGAPIRIVAGMGTLAPGACTYYGIVLRPGLDTTGTPRIRRMRASQDGASRYVVSSMLSRRGVELAAIETVRLPEAVFAMTLESGAIDAVAASEPILSRLREIGPLWLSGQDALPDFQWGVIAFGERLLARERGTGARFLRAYQRGVAQYREGKTDRNVAIIAEATGETPGRMRESCWPAFSSDSHVNWASIADFQTWANDEGLMEYTLSLAQAVDTLFAPSHHAVPAAPLP